MDARSTAFGSRRAAAKAAVQAAVAAVLLIPALSACGDSSSASHASGQTGKIDVSISPAPIGDAAPLFVAEQKGFFTKQGLNVTLQSPASSSAALIPLLSSGAVDLGVAGVPTLLQAESQHVGVAIVAGMSRFGTSLATDSGAIVVRSDSPITSMAQLNGHTVGVSGLKGGATIDVSLASETKGGDPSSLKYVAAPPPNLPGLVASGKIDAALVQEPFMTVALTADHLRRLSPATSIPPNAGTAAVVLASSSKWAKSNPQAVKKVQAAISEAVSWANDPANRSQLIQIIATNTKTPADVLTNTVLPVFSEKVTSAQVAPLERLAVKYGVLDKPIQVSSILLH